MNTHKIVILTGLIALAMTSCMKDSEIELPEVEDVITLNLILSPHEQPLAYLTNSIALTSEDPISDITDATISLYADDKFAGSFFPEEFIDMYGFPRIGYKSTQLISADVDEYAIQIAAPGYPDIEANTKTVAKSSSSETIRLDSISLVNPEASFRDYLGHFTLGFKDDNPAPNYYHILVYQEAGRIDHITGEWTPHSPIRSIPFTISDLTLEDEIISNDRHGYNLWRTSTFDGILVNDELFNTEYYTIESRTLLPSGGPVGPDGELLNSKYSVKMHAEVRSVNEDYYRYYRSLTLQAENRNNPFAEPVIIHSNVENGLGNLGYYTSVTSDTLYAEY